MWGKLRLHKNHSGFLPGERVIRFVWALDSMGVVYGEVCRGVWRLVVPFAWG